MTSKSKFSLMLLLVSLCSYGRGQAGWFKNTAAPAAVAAQDRCGAVPCSSAASAGASAEGVAPANVAVAPVTIRSASPDVPHSAEPTTPAGAADSASPMRHDFEDLVDSTLGHRLPLFGRGMFTNAPSSFVATDHVGVPADYVIGPGDELVIRSWGKVDTDARLTVDRNGQIFLPVVGAITVAGVPYHQVQSVVEVALHRQYRSFELSVTLGQLRSIQVFVLGRARRPGVYVVNALSTLVDTLFASGGPSDTGTLRDIQLKRNGRVISHFDLYDLLLHGDKKNDVPVIAGDVLFIPPVGMQVAIDGDVNVPAIYEMTAPSTTGQLIEDAGGLTAVAGTRRSTLERVEGHQGRRSDDIALEGDGLKLKLADGDVLRIYPISPRISNVVMLRGSVFEPGRYTWHPGMRVTDLVPTREALLTRSFFHGQNSAGTLGSTHYESADRDKRPGGPQHESEISWNYAVVERLSGKDLSQRLLAFNLGQAIDQPGSAQDLVLEAGDTVRIYSVDDLPVPQQMRAKFVKVDGEVMAPGTYRMQEGETLRDLVVRAGGFTPHTYLYASQLTRDSVRQDQEAKLKVILAREQREALSPVNQPRGTSDSPVSAQGELALREAYLAKLADIHPTGRVVLQIGPQAKLVTDVPEFALEDGDHFFLPGVPGVVNVLGSVYNEGSLRYVNAQPVTSYLDAAGGPTREADRSHEFILRADGTLVSRQVAGKFSRLTLYPGDSLVVPPRLSSSHTALDLRDLTQILSQFSITALAIRALGN